MDTKDKGTFTFPGLLWRTVAFLLGLLLISWLLSLLLGRSDRPIPPGPVPGPGPAPWEDSLGKAPYHGQDTTFVWDTLSRPIPPELRDTSIVRDWLDSIPGVRELPNPRDNYIPPVDTSRLVPSPDDPNVPIVADQLVVFFNSKDVKSDMASFAKQFKALYPQPGYSVLYYNPTAGTMLLGVPQDKLKRALEEIPRKITNIQYRITTNEIVSDGAATPPSDPDFKVTAYKQYFNLIQAFDAWEITRGVPEIKVAIVDSYFDLTNPEIGERYVDRIHIPSKTVNVLPPKVKPTLQNVTALCHGSHVAGIAIGAQNNSLGVSGIAPECSWIPVSLGDQMTIFNMIEGIMYAVYHGADVINVSLGRYYPPDAEKQLKQLPIGDQMELATTTSLRGAELWEWVYQVANDHNCVIVKAAGNESFLMGLDPKNRSDKIIKVEAVDGQGKMADFTNFGLATQQLNYSTVSAPGVNLWSVTDPKTAPVWAYISRQSGNKIAFSPKDGFQEMSGTSMAAPVVSGAVALLKSKNKELSTDEIIKILRLTAKQTEPSKKIGPTIQIKDALDATSAGQKLNFDDLLADHNLLVGKWKSTHELILNDASGSKIDDMWTYFIFPSPNKGTLQHSTINTRKDYQAPVLVKWGSSTVTFIQQSDAVAADGDKVNKDDFVCSPNSDRLLEVSCQRNGTERFKFMLEKVN